MNDTLCFDNIPDGVFLPVIQRRNIVRAKILLQSEKQKLPKGSPDIKLISPLCKPILIDRATLMKNYIHLSGKKIKLSGWKSGHEYVVMRVEELHGLAMAIPDGVTLDFRGNIIKPRRKGICSYIVCLVNSDGSIDRDSASIVTRGMFRKMFCMPINDAVAKYLGVRREKVSSIDEVDSVQSEVNNSVYQDSIQDGPVQSVSSISTKNISTEISNNTDSNSGYKLTAVARVLTHGSDKILGFIVKDKKRGIIQQVSKKEMLLLCSQKLVDNIMIATKEGSGTTYLRGNGIKIGDLPSQYLD